MRRPFAGIALGISLLRAQSEIPPLHTSIVITATASDEPTLDRKNSAVFERTLFSRDDQIFHVLDAGINAGQHEGGGKSIEVRRFGFNLDHGGGNGGLKVLIDNVQQNQNTQGHGQGYLGALKALTPELVQEANIINGPFSAEYGDFSGLGVVHIRLRESLPDEWTARMQGGSFGALRGFLGFSPTLKNGDMFVAYEGSATDGPFIKPLDYRRDNLTANITRRISETRTFGFKLTAHRNDYDSSGQIPLDEVAAGRLDRFGFLDPGEGGRVRAATAAMYFRHEGGNGTVWKADAFLSRSLFDMYSNFTYFLNNPVDGDGIQQHDSRLQQGANVQYLRPHRILGAMSLLTAGGNFHANQINVGLYPRVQRTPTGITTLAHANVTNSAGYLQDTLTLLDGRLRLGGGLRYDNFIYQVDDRLDPSLSLTRAGGRFQPKANIAFTPTYRIPLTVHINYGRGIASMDARGVAQSPAGTHLSTTGFYQVGTSSRIRRFSLTTGLFLIDRSNELVYVADDGSLQFQGPSRAYGFEAKTSVEITRHLSFNAGVTKVLNAFYRATSPRVYVDRAPRFTANAGLTVSGWKGWSGSFRLRAISHYLLDGEDVSLLAAGHTVIDAGVSKQIRRGIEFNFGVDNLANRSYYETQNYLESRLPGQDPRFRIHGTPGYSRTILAGITLRFRGK